MKKFVFAFLAMIVASSPDINYASAGWFGDSPASAPVVEEQNVALSGQKSKWFCGTLGFDNVWNPKEDRDFAKYLVSQGYLTLSIEPNQALFTEHYVPTEKSSQIAEDDNECYYRRTATAGNFSVVKVEEL